MSTFDVPALWMFHFACFIQPVCLTDRVPQCDRVQIFRKKTEHHARQMETKRDILMGPMRAMVVTHKATNVPLTKIGLPRQKNSHFWPNTGFCGPFGAIPDQKQYERVVFWKMGTKTFAPFQKIRTFGPKMTDFDPKYAFLAVFEIQVLPAHFVPCWFVGCWLMGAGCSYVRASTYFIRIFVFLDLYISGSLWMMVR